MSPSTMKSKIKRERTQARALVAWPTWPQPRIPIGWQLEFPHLWWLKSQCTCQEAHVWLSAIYSPGDSQKLGSPPSQTRDYQPESILPLHTPHWHKNANSLGASLAPSRYNIPPQDQTSASDARQASPEFETANIISIPWHNMISLTCYVLCIPTISVYNQHISQLNFTS